MATAAFPATARLPKRAVRVVLTKARNAADKALTPHKASLRRLTDIPMTVAGVGCIDFAAFHIAHGWGWLVTGLSLAVLEHVIADDESA